MAWVIKNAAGDLYRSMTHAVPVWTTNVDDALQFARRRDADLFAEEDEDAWAIVEVP